ncbi:MAG: lysine--tRNA ligase [Candidatus Uhrbacteria bacterium]|nr:lysine--tRNA ligase [Patescibacteria group bacterium]MBU1906711.1 lysine--tRNA ligase [Patescibacteria group bacterium]
MIEEEAARRARLAKARELGVDPYPTSTNRTHEIGRVLDMFAELEKEKTIFSIAGRIRTIRKHGGLTFIHVEDETGRIQVAMKKDHVGTELYEQFHELFDMGDFVEVQGTTFVTKTGEQSVLANSYRMLTKTLLPMPEKWHGLSDVEIRYRQRYLDMIANEQVRNTFRLRSKMIELIRTYFNERDFIEVETPILQLIPGGATAKPFKTHHNALDNDMYLRVAPELYLKRLLVGGFDRVYEIARCFRNEGIDNEHNPEFTQIEFYWAYADYTMLMDLMEELMPYLLENLGLGLVIPVQDMTADFTPPYPRISMKDLIEQHTGINIEDYPDAASLYAVAKKNGVDDVKETDGRGKIVDEIYKTHVRPKIYDPIFMIDHPVELSPLTKKKPEDPRYVERFQIVCAGGVELCNAFTELNDPLDQEERFKEQEALRTAGDEEAQRYDEDFIEALKHGMPPTGGLGMGLDRLAKMLTNASNLKEVILFPTLKPETLPLSKGEPEGVLTDSSSSADADETLEITGEIPTHENALKLLKKHLTNDGLIKHHLAAEMVMREFAKQFGEDEDLWGITGLLHDIDWEETKNNPEQHSLRAAEILEGEGIDCRIVYAIKAHNEMHGIKLGMLLDRTLFCVEELTGLITATALVQPDKSLNTVTVDSVLRKFRQKSFAKNVRRDIIERCEELMDMSLEGVIKHSLTAMKRGARELGL